MLGRLRSLPYKTLPPSAICSHAPLSAKPGHVLASEQLHRAPHARLGQTPEVHPAQHLAYTEAPQLVDLLRDRVGRAEGDGLGDELVPRDFPEPLRDRKSVV